MKKIFVLLLTFMFVFSCTLAKANEFLPLPNHNVLDAFTNDGTFSFFEYLDSSEMRSLIVTIAFADCYLSGIFDTDTHLNDYIYLVANTSDDFCIIFFPSDNQITSVFIGLSNTATDFSYATYAVNDTSINSKTDMELYMISLIKTEVAESYWYVSTKDMYEMAKTLEEN